MSGSAEGVTLGPKKEPCAHNVIRRKRSSDAHAFSAENVYVCGSCAKLFEVEEYVDKTAPSSDSRITSPLARHYKGER
jgi:branched-subunit amino acid aminotransferase/4-amino-4-deoxychorismate lyase